MDKQMIEEMAKVIESELGVFFGGGDTVEPEDFPYQAEGIAETIYNAGYRKIPENAVVITREEWKQIKSSLYYSEEERERRNQKMREETAEKFARKLKESGAIKAIALVRNGNLEPIHRAIVDKIDEICKEIVEEKE